MTDAVRSALTRCYRDIRAAVVSRYGWRVGVVRAVLAGNAHRAAFLAGEHQHIASRKRGGTMAGAVPGGAA